MAEYLDKTGAQTCLKKLKTYIDNIASGISTTNVDNIVTFNSSGAISATLAAADTLDITPTSGAAIIMIYADSSHTILYEIVSVHDSTYNSNTYSTAVDIDVLDGTIVLSNNSNTNSYYIQYYPLIISKD